MTVQECVNYLNQLKDSKYGSGFDVYDYVAMGNPLEGHDVTIDPSKGDLIIGYDYSDDECVDKTEANRLSDWIYNFAWPTLNRCLAENGCKEVYDCDGSGGGLYYGLTVFKK